MKTYWGVDVFLTSVLVRGEWASAWCPRDRLGGPQNWYGVCGEEKNCTPIENQTPTLQPSSQ
jgi:hypothetical protein